MDSSPLDALAPRDRAQVETLASTLDTAPLDARGALPGILPDLTRLLRAGATATYSLSAEEGGYAFESFEFAGELPGRFLESLRRTLRAGPRAFMRYDPASPEPRQRNRPRRIRTADLGADGQQLFGEAGTREQVRVLVCDGPALLAWVGGLTPEAFGPREEKVLAALTPALRRRLEFESLVREGAPSRSLLEVAITHVAAAAFVLRRGRVVMANAAAAALLRTRRSETLQQISALLRGSAQPDYELTWHPGTAGAPEYALVVGRAQPDLQGRLAHASRRWELTPRLILILEHVARGLGNKGIAAALRCSEKNVEFHMSRLLQRARCSSRSELLAAFWSGTGR